MRTPDPAFDLRAALGEELRIAAEELESAPFEARAVHQCRVRVKRARALARLGRVSAPGLSSVFIDAARGLMHNLAHARDIASMSEAATLEAKKGGKQTSAAFTTVARALEETAAPQFDLEAARSALKDLIALAQVWPETSNRQIRRGAKRLTRRARRARARGIDSLDPARRHRWRNREKDRFYAASILGDAWPGKRRLKLTEKIGDALGGERDALLLMERLLAKPELAGEESVLRRAVKALRRRRAKLARRANALAARMRN